MASRSLKRTCRGKKRKERKKNKEKKRNEREGETEGRMFCTEHLLNGSKLIFDRRIGSNRVLITSTTN